MQPTNNMKSLGLIGGTSWHSTIEYYRIINQSINDHFGNNTNPPLMLYTMNQAQIHKYQVEDNWAGVAEMVIDAGSRLIAGGADALMCCANTPHKVYRQVTEQLNVPMLHIADATAAAIQQRDRSSVGFIGTRFSMTEEFVTGRIAEHGIRVLVPEAAEELKELHRIIQKELTFGKIVPSSKQFVMNSIQSMVDRGAEGIILGCTEFPLMINSEDLEIPVFDTTTIHAKAAAKFVLGLDS